MIVVGRVYCKKPYYGSEKCQFISGIYYDVIHVFRQMNYNEVVVDNGNGFGATFIFNIDKNFYVPSNYVTFSDYFCTLAELRKMKLYEIQSRR